MIDGGCAAVRQSSFTVLPISAWTCWWVIHKVGGTRKVNLKWLSISKIDRKYRVTIGYHDLAKYLHIVTTHNQRITSHVC